MSIFDVAATFGFIGFCAGFIIGFGLMICAMHYLIQDSQLKPTDKWYKK